MKKLKDSIELHEAARISDELVAAAAVTVPENPDPDWPKVTLAEIMPIASQAKDFENQATEASSSSSAESQPTIVYREEQLENVLVTMCKRGGFNGAVIADNIGFPLVVYNSPVENEILPAFTSVLGMALKEAGKLLDEHEANHITLDINYTEKAALRQFFIDDQPYFMMIICSQEVDEKAEVELSIDQIATILR